MVKFNVLSLACWMLLFYGCSYPLVSYQKIREDMQTVDLTDRVSKKEAVIIAQNFLINKGLADRLYTLEPFQIDRRYIWEKDGEEDVEFVMPPADEFQHGVTVTWHLLFRDKEESWFSGRYPVIPFYVDVDFLTGEVVEFGLKRDKDKRDNFSYH